METKTCKICNEAKPLTEFSHTDKRKKYLRSYCKPCNRELINSHNQKRKKEDPDYFRRRDARVKYGIEFEDYQRMYSEQEGKCSICSVEADRLNIDHCHTTGKVRGLLCWDCNVAIGKFKDNVALLQQAIHYLQST